MSIPGFFAEFGSVDENASRYPRLSFRGPRQPSPSRITGAFIVEDDWWGDGSIGGGAGGHPGELPIHCYKTCGGGRQVECYKGCIGTTCFCDCANTPC